METELQMRVTELESRQAFQDDTIQALNDALVAQQRLIERLELQVAALALRQAELQSQVLGEDDVPPPHY